MMGTFALEVLYSKYIVFGSSVFASWKIQDDPCFWPFFKNAIGAIDGSHIPARLPARERAAYQNCKGFLSKNCLFACDFNFNFSYVLTGWEGSATDARVFQDVCQNDLEFPQQKYLLADAGFPSTPNLLVPYRNTRYHLAEWSRASRK